MERENVCDLRVTQIPHVMIPFVLTFDYSLLRPKVVPPEFVMRMKLRYPVFYDVYVTFVVGILERHRTPHASIQSTVNSDLCSTDSEIRGALACASRRVIRDTLTCMCHIQCTVSNRQQIPPVRCQININNVGGISNSMSVELQPPTMTVGELKGSVCQLASRARAISYRGVLVREWQ